MEATEVLLVGGGGHAKVVADCLCSQGKTVKGFFENGGQGKVLDFQFLGKYNPALHASIPVIVAIGDNAVRKRIVLEEVKHLYTTTIHPSVILSTYASIGEGSMLLHGAIVQAEAKIGRHVIINTGSQIDHDCIVGDFVHIAPSAVLCGTVEVGERSLIGANAVVRPKVKIGVGVTIGAGAVVVKDVPDFAVVAGNPARILKYNVQ